MRRPILVIGSGAREHQIAMMYQKSGYKVVVSPGNQGMTLDDIQIYPGTSLKDANSFLNAAKELNPELVDVAQDDALAAGTVDLLSKEFFVFGPTKEAAQIESGKIWSREKQVKYGISTPEFEAFERENSTSAIDYAFHLLRTNETVFFKADGLYAGKGVIPARNEKDIEFALHEINKMGDASKRFLVEAGMVGEEFSFYVMCDGKNYLTFKSAQDNKRVWNGDNGPNTGGMGTNSPALVTTGIEDIITKTIIEPLINGLSNDGIEYKGIIYFGGMKLTDGSVGVVEFNSRWGDPESQVVLPSIQNQYMELASHAIDGTLNEVQLRQDNLSRVCVVGASSGYPGDYAKGKEIFVDKQGFPKDAYFLSAGINVKDNRMFTNGGRVFNIIGVGEDVIKARQNAMQGMACVTIEGNGLHYRTDIAWRDVQRVQQQNYK